ncbi:KAT8 regulatory NSL complex subunit dim gamma-tubulin 1 [Arctopsyche grandis]|uniref:KAT8 regulatory NSL complex subunit dim gamma-tubulin 1 n=1 Tax=Arctopsyche grandis TaxID=121162 RepID=UPI00406D75EE
MAPSKMAPDDPQAIVTPEQQKIDKDALRAQLHDEIEKKSKACGHRKYACHLPRLPGWSRCQLHILDEQNAPYRRCRHTGAHRCLNPAPILNSKKDTGLCFEHARNALILRMRAMSKPAPKPGPESLLLSLQHHVMPERVRTESCASQVSVVSEASDANESQTISAPDPFKQIDATEINASIGPSILECWSSSSDSEDGDEPRRNTGIEEDSSGAEDTPLDSDPLRFAGIYTAEEVVREMGSSLKRLQALYLGQLKVLTRRLKEARRNYLYSLKSEKETHCSIHSQGASNNIERQQLSILKSTSSYRKRHGVDAILQKKLYEKRSKVVDGNATQKSSKGRCCFTEGGVKCPRMAMPAARHCLKHILSDRHQVLFRSCGVNKAGIVCQEPTAALHPTATCAFHADLLPYQTYSMKKYESDSEDGGTGSSTKDSLHPHKAVET